MLYTICNQHIFTFIFRVSATEGTDAITPFHTILIIVQEIFLLYILR